MSDALLIKFYFRIGPGAGSVACVAKLQRQPSMSRRTAIAAATLSRMTYDRWAEPAVRERMRQRLVQHPEPGARMNRSECILCALALLTIGSGAVAQQQSSQGGFKTVDNPGGGHFIYGPLTGRGTLSQAVVYMLRQVHGHFGNRPEVGKFLQSRWVADRDILCRQRPEARQQTDASLLIVVVATDGSGSTAVLYDDRARFGKSEPVMMKSLSAVWHPAGSAAQTSTSTPSSTAGRATGGVPPLTQITGGDHSAAISAPAGWKVTNVSSGALTAEGPKGERVFLALVYQGVRGRSDLFASFVTASNQARIKNGFQAADYSQVTQTNIGPQGRAVQALFTVDLHDGSGPRKGSVRVDYWRPLHSASAVPTCRSVLPRAKMPPCWPSFIHLPKTNR